jgi:PAS domain S-box-containing protein
MKIIIDYLKKLLDPSGFMPRWNCGKWSESEGWLYILSDINIGISYIAIPLMIFFFVRKRKDVPFPRIFILFGLFIGFCGLTHIADAIMFWAPVYRLNAIILLVTAVLSTATLTALYKVLPQAFNLKSPAQLQKIIDKQILALQASNQKLKESEEQFKALVNNNPDIIILMGKDLEYKFLNESSGQITSRKIEEYIGKKPSDILPGQSNSKLFMEHLNGVLKTGKEDHYEVETVTEKKGVAYYEIDLIPLFDDKGNVNNVLTITKDVTQVKNNEAQLKTTIDRLEKLSKRLDFKRNVLQDFAYIVSHNLRSPTGNLMSLLNILKRTDDAEKKNS